MFPISKILAPVDFSERCLATLPYAAAIAARYNAELTLLHVVNPVYTVPAGPFEPVLVSIPRSVFTDAVKHLEVFGTDLLGGIEPRRLMYEGDPVEQIAGFVQTEGTQLVVMSTHGFGLLRRFLLGSVTAKVLHDVQCPVLTSVHKEQQPFRANSAAFSKVICAVDLGPHSRRILEWAAGFARDFKARLGIVHASAASTGNEHEELKKLLEAA